MHMRAIISSKVRPHQNNKTNNDSNNNSNNNGSDSLWAEPPLRHATNAITDTDGKNATATDRASPILSFDPPPKQFLNDTDSLYFNKSDFTANYLNETYWEELNLIGGLTSIQMFKIQF